VDRQNPPRHYNRPTPQGMANRVPKICGQGGLSIFHSQYVIHYNVSGEQPPSVIGPSSSPRHSSIISLQDNLVEPTIRRAFCFFPNIQLLKLSNPIHMFGENVAMRIMPLLTYSQILFWSPRPSIPGASQNFVGSIYFHIILNHPQP
jgi:hypothetical protein